MHPPSFPILIVAEGRDWLVVSKPPHLLVHPTRPGGPITLLDGLRGLLSYEVATGGQVSLIHRLDRETSGLLLVAKTATAARRFSLEMMHGRIAKEYLALVRGWPEWDTCVVDAPLLRQGEQGASRIWLKRTVHPAGAPARTRFEVVRRAERAPSSHDAGGRFSLVRAVPETGRLHQIRVHLAHVGYPVVGDKIYGPDEDCYLRFIDTGWSRELARCLWLDRHALHAWRLTFDDPEHGRRTVESALPSDMAMLLASDTSQAAVMGECDDESSVPRTS
jgi:23S rRNA pseudouridine1911/1915/1917 synthase